MKNQPSNLTKQVNSVLEYNIQEAQNELDILNKKIKARNEIADDAEARLIVIGEQIKAKNIELNRANQELDDFREACKEEEKSHQLKINNLNAQFNTKEGQLKEIDTRLESRRQQSIQLNKDNDVVLTQIKDNKQYLKNQEDIVNDTVAEWNAQLVEFRQEAESLQDEKNKLLTSTVRLEEDKKILDESLVEADNKLRELEKVYKEAVDEYKKELHVLANKVTEKKNELVALDRSLESRVKAIETKESEILVKQAALDKREADLNAKEQRLRSNFALSGLEYN